jgi:hypothetical protein
MYTLTPGPVPMERQQGLSPCLEDEVRTMVSPSLEGTDDLNDCVSSNGLSATDSSLGHFTPSFDTSAASWMPQASASPPPRIINREKAAQPHMDGGVRRGDIPVESPSYLTPETQGQYDEMYYINQSRISPRLEGREISVSATMGGGYDYGGSGGKQQQQQYHPHPAQQQQHYNSGRQNWVNQTHGHPTRPAQQFEKTDEYGTSAMYIDDQPVYVNVNQRHQQHQHMYPPMQQQQQQQQQHFSNQECVSPFDYSHNQGAYTNTHNHNLSSPMSTAAPDVYHHQMHANKPPQYPGHQKPPPVQNKLAFSCVSPSTSPRLGAPGTGPVPSSPNGSEQSHHRGAHSPSPVHFSTVLAYNHPTSRSPTPTHVLPYHHHQPQMSPVVQYNNPHNRSPGHYNHGHNPHNSSNSQFYGYAEQSRAPPSSQQQVNVFD